MGNTLWFGQRITFLCCIYRLCADESWDESVSQSQTRRQQYAPYPPRQYSDDGERIRHSYVPTAGGGPHGSGPASFAAAGQPTSVPSRGFSDSRALPAPSSGISRLLLVDADNDCEQTAARSPTTATIITEEEARERATGARPTPSTSSTTSMKGRPLRPAAIRLTVSPRSFTVDC